jgi:hypothetical protein
LRILFLDLAHQAGGAQLGAVFEGLGILALGRRGVEGGRVGRFDGVGGDEIGADGRVEGGEGELRAVAGLDEVFVGLGELGFEVEDVGFDGTAGVEALAGDAEAFLDAGDGLRLHVGEGLRLQDAVEAAGDLVDELVAGGGEGLRRWLAAPWPGHVLAGGALEIEEPPLGADAAAQVFGVAGSFGLKAGSCMFSCRWLSVIMNAWGGLSLRA